MTVNIGILTSSRADYSIYYPLAKAIEDLPSVQLTWIVFGSHLSEKFGYTINAIENDGFTNFIEIPHTIAESDQPVAIASAMGHTTQAFADCWQKHSFDVVFCLGDRYEMFSAVASAVPFRVPMVHLYGGEQTLGAIDDCLRHSISHMSHWHFTSCEPYRQRVIRLIENNNRVFNYGHLSIDNLRRLPLWSVDELKNQCGVDFSIPTILCTFHPETVAFEKNAQYALEICEAFQFLSAEFQVLITMPNADTGAQSIRDQFLNLAFQNAKITTTENMGTIGYLSAMKHAALLVGNTSSGFVEASWFPKTVINLGERQAGRILTPNIQNIPITANAIIDAVEAYKNAEWEPEQTRIYGDGYTAEKIASWIISQFLTSSNND